MIKRILMPCVFALLLAGCKREYHKGLYNVLYIKYTDKPGPKIREGDFVSIYIIAKTDLDSLIGSSYNDGVPRLMILPKPSFGGDYIDALKLMAEGDSLSVKMSNDSIFKNTPQPAAFKGKFVIYDMKVNKVIPRGKLSETDFMARVNGHIKMLTNNIKNAEPGKIARYLQEHKAIVTKTSSGLYYTIHKRGAGALLAPGDTAVINYTGSLFNGKIFDTNIYRDAVKAKTLNVKKAYQPVAICMGQKKMIAGLEEGLLLLKKGAKATFIIPSKLAYGEQGFSLVGAYTPILYQMELLDIIHPKARP